MFFWGGCYNFHVLVRFCLSKTNTTDTTFAIPTWFRSSGSKWYTVDLGGFGLLIAIPSVKLTASLPLKIKPWKRRFLLQTIIFGGLRCCNFYTPRFYIEPEAMMVWFRWFSFSERAPILRWTMIFRGCKSWFTAFSLRSLSLEFIGKTKNPLLLWNLQTPHTNGKKLASGKCVFLSYLGLLPFQVFTIHHEDIYMFWFQDL